MTLLKNQWCDPCIDLLKFVKFWSFRSLTRSTYVQTVKQLLLKNQQWEFDEISYVATWHWPLWGLFKLSKKIYIAHLKRFGIPVQRYQALLGLLFTKWDIFFGYYWLYPPRRLLIMSINYVLFTWKSLKNTWRCIYSRHKNTWRAILTVIV